MQFSATWMILQIIILCKVSQKEKDKYHMISPIWNLKYHANELTEQKQIRKHRKNNLRLPKGMVRGDTLGVLN